MGDSSVFTFVLLRILYIWSKIICHLADVAISAPFTSSARSASGSVYIYHSSTSATQILTINPQQVKLQETWHLDSCIN